MTLSNGLAAAAVIVSLISAAAAIMTSRRQTTLQTRLAAIEEERRREEVESRDIAVVTAAFESEDRPGQRTSNRYLALRNAGPAVARNVSIEILEPVGERTILPRLHTAHQVLPIDRMPALQQLRLPVIIQMYTAGYVRCRLSWEDDTGQREEMLTLAVYT